MAIAKALPGLNDLRTVTPSDLSNLLRHVVDAVNTEPLLISCAAPNNFFSSFGFSFESIAFSVKLLFSLVANRSFGFTAVSIATPVLHSIASVAVYNLFMHLSLANQRQDSLWSIN